MVDNLEVTDFLEGKDDIFQEGIPPSSLPHTLASLNQAEDDTPIYVTDDIINNIVVDDCAVSLFAPDSKTASRASSAMASPRVSRRSRKGRQTRKDSQVMSVGSILHRNLLANFTHIGDLEENHEEEK